jgi:hypothetical protein
MVMKAPNEKGLSADQIPIELIKHSEAARVMVWKLIVIVWDLMAASAPGEKLDIPEDFVRATLVCLYKGKGSRDDPAKYRGISLISMVERFIASLLLGRIGASANKHMKQSQAGFRPLKSCRDAVFRLWRDLEKMKTDKMPCIYTFVDYSKAFDSLVWARMWEILVFSGCPPQLVAVIRSLHEQATIALRINSEGDLAEAFAQMKGIRQGSGLSPCLFVLVLDFVMRAYEEACAEQGLDRTDTWNAYADDVVEKNVMREGETLADLEANASTAMQLLEGAAGFTGLLVNVPKTEAMACGVRQTQANRKEAWSEHVRLTFPGRGRNGHRSLESFYGWISDAKWSRQLGVQDSIFAEVQRLETMHPDARAVVIVLDEREGVEGPQALTAAVPEDLSASSLSPAMITLRDDWIAAVPKELRDRLQLRLTSAATPKAAWHHIIASVESDKTSKRAERRQIFLDAIEVEKQVAESSSSDSIHNADPPRGNVSRGKRLHDENARVAAVELLLKQVRGGKRRVLVLAEKGGGCMYHSNGAVLASQRHGFSQCMNGETFGFVDCPGCDVTMLSPLSLTLHQNCHHHQGEGYCLGYREAMQMVAAGTLTEDQLAQRAAGRLQQFKKSGRLEKDAAVPVEVMTCNGNAAKTCDTFVYLGTMVSPDGLAQGEIRRRAQRAWAILGDLDNIWKSRCIKWALKGQLFSALVLSVLLYNAEVWPLTKNDATLLEGIYTRMTRSICLRHVHGQSVLQQKKMQRVKKGAVLNLLKLPTMPALLRQKRMRWVGHALRRDDDDYSKIGVKKELALRSNPWTKCVLSDMKTLGFQNVQQLETKSLNRANFRKITSAHTQI